MIEETYLSKALLSGFVCAFIASVLNPFDVVKIRMQNNSAEFPWTEKRFIVGIMKLYREEGLQGTCKGMNATILRELLYSSIRMGAYEPIRTLLHPDNSQPASPAVKYFSSLLSGGIGATLANPTDLLKVNFQALMPGKHLPYTSTFGGFLYIFKNQGFLGLYKGTLVTAFRASILNTSQLGSYDIIKNNILRRHFDMDDGLQLHLVSSLLASVITTTAANPGMQSKDTYWCRLQT
jgi:hypothetical protein